MLRGVTGCYKGLPEVTRGNRGLQRVTWFTEGYKGLQGVKTGYKGLQEVTRGNRGLQRVTWFTEG